MKALIRGLLVLGLGLLWFEVGAPRAEAWIEKEEINRRPGRSAADMRALLKGLPPEQQPGPAQRLRIGQLLEGAARAQAAEAAWAPRVAGVLTVAQRREAETLEISFREGKKRTDFRADPGLVALAQELMEAFGQPGAQGPALPAQDPWGGYTTRQRVRALRALLRAGGLQREQAGPLLTATLEAITAQELRIELEEQAAEQMPDLRLRAAAPM